MKVGILLPRSAMHPKFGMDFLESVRLALQTRPGAAAVTLAVENIGFGAVEKEVYTQAEKLLVIEGVDVLISFTDERVNELLKPLFSASGKLILIVNPGANVPLSWISQPNVLHLDLHYAFCTALTGSRVTESGKMNAAVASSLFDCGFLHIATMLRTFQESKGKPRHHYIYKDFYKPELFTIQPLTDFLDSEKDTRNILAVLDTWPARLFYEKLVSWPSAAELSLFVSPRMLEADSMPLPENGFPFPVSGHIPWYPELEQEANTLFVETFRKKTKRIPDVWSLLGWEAGLLIAAIQTVAEDAADGEALVQFLQQTPVQGPRGLMKPDPVTGYFILPVYWAQLAAGEKSIQYEIHPDMAGVWEEFSGKDIEGVVSGWTNTYLCY